MLAACGRVHRPTLTNMPHEEENDRRSKAQSNHGREIITPIQPLLWGQPQIFLDAWRATLLNRRRVARPINTHVAHAHLDAQWAGLRALPTRDTPWPDPRPGTRPMYDKSRAVGLGVRGPLAATIVGLHREKPSHWPNWEDHHWCWTPSGWITCDSELCRH